MEWVSTSSWVCCSRRWTVKNMIEQAQEELQILEAQHPNRFGYLKRELKSFISHLESQSLVLCAECDVPNTINKAASSVSTQESTSSSSSSSASAGKKRKEIGTTDGPAVEGNNVEFPKKKEGRRSSCIRNVDDDSCKKSKQRIIAVFERAHACLLKIQHLKSNFS